jgi:hypothetical protein
MDLAKLDLRLQIFSGEVSQAALLTDRVNEWLETNKGKLFVRHREAVASPQDSGVLCIIMLWYEPGVSAFGLEG